MSVQHSSREGATRGLPRTYKFEIIVGAGALAHYTEFFGGNALF